MSNLIRISGVCLPELEATKGMVAQLANVACGSNISASEVEDRTDLTTWTPPVGADFEHRMMWTVEKGPAEQVCAFLAHALIPRSHPVINTHDPYNAVLVEDGRVGQFTAYTTWHMGPRATGGVVAALLEGIDQNNAGTTQHQYGTNRGWKDPYFFSFEAKSDSSPVSKLADAFDSCSVPVQSVERVEQGEHPFYMLFTFPVVEGKIRSAFDSLRQVTTLRNVAYPVRVLQA